MLCIFSISKKNHISNYVIQARHEVEDAVEKYLDKCEMDGEQEEGDDDEDKDEEPQKKWDCESILSTYSNIYNHPKLIAEPLNPKIRGINHCTCCLGISFNAYSSFSMS